MQTKGKFFVIDGSDGSGKGTQTKLIIEQLTKDGYDILEADFPQYGQKSAALVEEYLNGKFGDFNEVDAYQASIFYACDRFAASKKMKEHLAKGGIIISNRYVSSNMIHQSSKIEDEKELNKFLDWVENLEYNIFKIPIPDKVFFLNVPYEIGQQLCKKKTIRSYIENEDNTDIHESSQEHLRAAYNRATLLTQKYPHWIEIKCAPNNQLLSIEEINRQIYTKLKQIIDTPTANKIKIYFLGSIRGGRDDVSTYNEILNFLRGKGSVLGQQIGDSCITHLGELNINDNKIYEREIRHIFNSNILIAEISTPSLGVGYNISKAIEQNKPVLCLYNQHAPKELSAIIAASPIQIKKYNNIEEAKQIIQNFIKEQENILKTPQIIKI